jgi:exodeoxyribonuclease VIII
MNDIMLDLETMGNNNDAAIVAIGAVKFNLKTYELGEEFYYAIDLESSMKSGGTVNADTIMWWIRQSSAAKSALSTKVVRIENALCKFSDYVKKPDSNRHVWGNGATFDNVILSSAYQRFDMEVPFTYKDERCYRTVRRLFPLIEKESVGTKHNALDDAKSQAIHLLKILKSVGVTRS